MANNYQLKFKEVVWNNQTTIHSNNKTLRGVVSFLYKMILICFNFDYFQEGEYWNPPGDNCTVYTCEKHADQFIQVIKQTNCPAFNPDECDPVSTVLPVLIFGKVAVPNTSDRRIMVCKENN